jgi:hypothetical protein
MTLVKNEILYGDHSKNLVIYSNQKKKRCMLYKKDKLCSTSLILFIDMVDITIFCRYTVYMRK